MNLTLKMQQNTARQQEILNAAKKDSRDLAAEEQAEYDLLQREIEILVGWMDGGEDPPETDDSAGRTAEEERGRILEIGSLCREFGLESEQYVKNGASVEEVRKAVLEHIKAHGAPVTRGAGTIEIVDGQDKFRAAAADALVMRGGVTLDKPTAGAKELMGMSLRDLAVETMQEREGGLSRKSGDELFGLLLRQFYNPTAAFPAIMDQAINKSYVEGHKTAPVTFDQWTKKGTLKDFKIHDNHYLAGPAGEFLEVPEGSELKHDLPTDAKMPTRKLKTFGRQFSMTRQAFINDDIDFLSRIPAKYAASARKTLNKQVYQIVLDNAVVYDGMALFCPQHKNIMATGTGITRESIQSMFMALQLQTDQFGEAVIIRPAYIVVPIGYAFDMYTIFESPYLHAGDNTQAVNPLYQYRSRIAVIEDPTINVLCGSNTMPWFLVGDKSDTDSIEVDYLNGQEIPNIRRMEAAGQLGYVWDIYLDWGVNVMDYRGIVKNTGAAGRAKTNQ